MFMGAICGISRLVRLNYFSLQLGESECVSYSCTMMYNSVTEALICNKYIIEMWMSSYT